MLATSCVAELNVQELIVIPDPKVQAAPFWKFVPVTVTVHCRPCSQVVGVAPLTVGAGNELGRRISTHARSALVVSAARLAPTWIANRGLLSTNEGIPVSPIHVVPPFTE